MRTARKKGNMLVMGAYKTLLPYVKKHALQYIAGFVFLILADTGQILIPGLLQQAIDTISGGESIMARTTNIGLMIIVIAVMIALGRFFWRFFIVGTSRNIETELREQYFSHLLKLSASWYQNTTTGDLMARATNDLNAIRMASGFALISFTDGVFMTVVIIVILFTRYPSLALVTIAPIPVVTVLIIMLGRFVGSRFKRVQKTFAAISSKVQETLIGIRVIKSFAHEQKILDDFKAANTEYKNANMSLVKLWGLFFPLISFISGLASLLLLRFGGEEVLLKTMTPGHFVAVMSYLGMLIWPMMGAGITVNILQRGKASLERFNEVMDQQPHIKNLGCDKPQVDNLDIEIKDLTFSYPGSESPVLSDINIRIPSGSTFGIFGKTASGKSTLIKLIPRLYEVPEGCIFIGNKEIHEYDLHSLRSVFGLVPQNTLLFSSSIKENILFAKPHADTETALHAARVSTISRDLAIFPDGLNTIVGERGITLSGGQKQRIAISRALVSDAPVMVFDDALSNVDTETEKRILSELINERKGKTTIIIAHRVSTLEKADHIIVLDNGRIVQEGTHTSLVSKEGIYSEIYNLQRLNT